MQGYQATTTLKQKYKHTHFIPTAHPLLEQSNRQTNQPHLDQNSRSGSRLPSSPINIAHSPDPDQYVPAWHRLHAEAPASVMFIWTAYSRARSTRSHSDVPHVKLAQHSATPPSHLHHSLETVSGKDRLDTPKAFLGTHCTTRFASKHRHHRS